MQIYIETSRSLRCSYAICSVHINESNNTKRAVCFPASNVPYWIAPEARAICKTWQTIVDKTPFRIVRLYLHISCGSSQVKKAISGPENASKPNAYPGISCPPLLDAICKRLQTNRYTHPGFWLPPPCGFWGLVAPANMSHSAFGLAAFSSW